ncbi:transcriptional regulator, AraC family [Bosea lathyri]|uniref:Transcriptional regulator, AraC family n=2 Tax=Bosea lathyri TaxID=1036778 RepID=A0A1H6BYH0_9HYPH|nr:transcriptional regulator, AraC family [Bosea lathyri]
MSPIQFSTHGLPPREQIEAWRGWFDSVFDVVPGAVDDGFTAQSTTWTLDGFALSRVAAPSLQATRTKALIRRNPIDHWAVTLGQRTTTGLGGNGETLNVPARTPFVVSLGRGLVSQRSQDERLQLYLPRDTFGELAPMLDAVQGQALNTPLGKLLGDYLVLLEQSLAGLTPADLPRLTNAVRAMMLACVAPSTDHAVAAANQIDISRRERARQIIGRHLRHPSMGTDTLCRELGMSRSQVYRLLQNDGGVMHYIQRRRLLQAYADLSDLSNTRSITAIAESLCFPDASSFTRAFRQEFGVSPRDVRAVSLTGQALLPVPRHPPGSEIETLRDCLRQF